jgi:curved DNA-binding protein
MAAFKDYYQVLGIARDAAEKEVRRAFRALAAKHHPDRNPNDPGAEERFKEINEAYTVLSDPEKRSVYDRFGSGGPQAGGWPGGSPPGQQFHTAHMSPEDAAGFSDFFRSLFGAGFPAGGDPFAGGGHGVRARSVEATLQVPLERAFHGGTTTVAVDGRSLDVNLPAGIREGAKLRLRGQAPGGGDLILVIQHAPHPQWRLEGTTLRGVTDVADHLAALGGMARVQTFDGVIEVQVPPGTSSGRKLRLRGRGWPPASGQPASARGDAVVEVRVTVPAELSEAQRTAYRQLQALSTPDQA